MNLFNLRIKVADLIIAVVILSVLVAAIYFAIDPKEMANKKYDSMFSPTSAAIGEVVSKHFEKQTTPFTKSIPFAPGDKVLKDLGLYDQFAGDKFIIDNLDKFFIGKKEGTGESVYVCFTPHSKFTRDAMCNDSFVYTLGSDGSRTIVSCDVNTTWQTESNPWFICSPR